MKKEIVTLSIILIMLSLIFTSIFIFKKDVEKVNKNISVILETNEGNIESNTFPSKEDYEYLSTECKNTSDNINTTFNEETWKLNLNVEEERIDGKFNCTVHFKENIKPNEPVLDENMIPVYYSEEDSTWKVADKENKSTEHKWYDYEEKMWANSVTVKSDKREEYKTGSLGTEIKMEDILTMQVWIPRYKYKVWNYNLDGTKTSEPQEIEIKFEKGTNTTGDIKCTDNIQGESGDGTSEVCTINNEECSDNLCNGAYYTHPAFTFGSVDLTGFWVGKFEVSSDINCIPLNYSTLGEDCNLSTINPLTKPNTTSWRGAPVSTFFTNIKKMDSNGNIYGLSSNVDSHMIKNIEWGAVAYLSHSKYGTCTNGICKEIGMNNNSNYITGCGAISGSSESTTCNSYETELGESASTTGNIYGVYDMSGGAHDAVMANTVNKDASKLMSGLSLSENSGYSGIVYESGKYSNYVGDFSYPEEKYYDKYSFSSSGTNIIRSKLGDSIKEVVVSKQLGWYNDYSLVASAGYPWIVRGGYYIQKSNTGIFCSRNFYGYKYEPVSSRIIINN